MGENAKKPAAFVCRGQCAAGACTLDECVRTHTKRRRWDPPEPSVDLLAEPPVGDVLVGAAVDIGSTTLELRLVDLDSGQEFAAASARNMQARYGSDVISRIEYAAVSEDGTRKMHELVRAQISGLLDAVLAQLGLTLDSVRSLAAAGNTTMLHLAAGLSPADMGTYPFTPVTQFGQTMPPEVLGLPSACRVYFAPCVSAFIGADVVCAAMAVRSETNAQPAVLADLGTNGEIIGWSDGTVVAASTAAGPVFEGGSITCGMPAIPGAVRGVQLEGRELLLETIPGAPPAGLCGSGIVDALAAALHLGSVDSSGAIVPGRPYVAADQEGRPVFQLADNVLLSQRDVREIQAAKAAVRAGIGIVQGALAQPDGAPQRLFLAGGLGAAIRPQSAACIGIVPPHPPARAAGNAALRGAVQILLDPSLEEGAGELARAVQPIDLALNAGFQERYIDEMEFREGGIEI